MLVSLMSILMPRPSPYTFACRSSVLIPSAILLALIASVAFWLKTIPTLKNHLLAINPDFALGIDGQTNWQISCFYKTEKAIIPLSSFERNRHFQGVLIVALFYPTSYCKAVESKCRKSRRRLGLKS